MVRHRPPVSDVGTLVNTGKHLTGQSATYTEAFSNVICGISVCVGRGMCFVCCLFVPMKKSAF